MKVNWFHLMPYRWLPEDFRERYHSVWADIPSILRLDECPAADFFAMQPANLVNASLPRNAGFLSGWSVSQGGICSCDL